MTITATPNATNAPPKIDVTVSIPAGSVMQSVSLYRIDSGTPTLVRTQPSAGFDSRTVSDFEAPYEVPVVYQWTTSYVDASAITQLWTEPWANLSAWTVVGASWAVSGGKLIWSGYDDPTATVTRAVTPGRYQIVFDAAPVGIQTVSFGAFYIDVTNSRLISGSQVATFAPGTTSWIITVSTTGVSITTSAGTFSVTASVLVSQVQFAGAVAAYPAASSDFTLPSGSGTGQFTGGATIAFDPTSGNVLISDPGNARIQIWTAAGTYVGSFGTSGTGNGQFTVNDSIKIAVDSSRNVFAAASNRIQKFTWNGTTYAYSSQVGSTGTGNGQFNKIGGIAVDTAGLVYATDRGVDPTGTLLTTNNRVQRFTNGLVYSTQFGTYGTANGQFTTPAAIAVDSLGNIVVSDSTNRVQVFNSSLTFSRMLAPQGVADGSIYGDYFGIAAQGTTFYVVSQSQVSLNGTPARLQKFKADGTFINRLDNVGIAGSSMSSNDLPVAVNSAGTVYIRDVFAGVMHRWTQTKASIDDVTVNQFGLQVTVNETSAPVTLSPGAAWLVHPSQTTLSFPIYQTDGGKAGIAVIDTIANPSTATLHQILGSRNPVVTTNGPRASDQVSVGVTTVSRAEEIALEGLLTDQSPILIRIPPSWGVGFDDGFYSVGDYQRDRFIQWSGETRRSHTLPLTAVDSPITTVANTGWSWAALAAAFPTWTQVAAAFATWADVATNTRRPGF